MHLEQLFRMFRKSTFRKDRESEKTFPPRSLRPTQSKAGKGNLGYALFRKGLGDGRAVGWLHGKKALAAKPGDLTVIPEPHMVERKR